MATEFQLQTNRANAQLSTGPKSEKGKAVACQNALNHGLRTNRILLENEDPDEFHALAADLYTALQPVGPAEAAIVERIVIAIWRQRRLVAAEAAALWIDQRPEEIVKSIRWMETGPVSSSIDLDSLQPFDEDHKAWCQAVDAEFGTLDSFDVEAIQETAPHIYEQLKSDAEGDDETVEELLNGREGGLQDYVVELVHWCRRELEQAEKRPAVLALAEQWAQKKLVLPLKQLEVFARYQTTLDNQLYKALRALREAQDWRRATERIKADDDG